MQVGIEAVIQKKYRDPLATHERIESMLPEMVLWRVFAVAHRKRPQTTYIAEWTKAKGMKPAHVAQALGLEKTTVGRWMKGTIPHPDYLQRLAELFQLESAAVLFQKPETDADLRRKAVAARISSMDEATISIIEGLLDRLEATEPQDAG